MRSCVLPSRKSHPLLRLLRSIVSACPYTLAASALIRWARLILGRGDVRREASEQRLLGGVKLGRNIALIGLFCPLFWVSLFSGASAETVRFNAMHSGCVFIAGLAWMVKSLVHIEWRRRSHAAEARRSTIRA